MCSIVGLQGIFKGNDIVKMLKSSKNRGPDSSGVYLNNVILDIDLDEFDDCREYDIGFGHNLLSIYDNVDRISKPQPVLKDNLVLVFNGELYNFLTIRNLVKKLGVDVEIISDSEVLLYLIDYFYNDDLLKAVQMAVNVIDGDYAFAVFDGHDLAVARDPLGVKPLFYSCDDVRCGFASSKQALYDVGFKDISTLKPEHILFNWNDISPTQHIYEKVYDADVNKTDKLLKLSLSKRIEG